MGYKLTINIESALTKTNEQDGTTGSSLAGHMWYQISDASSNGTKSYGFAPDESHHGSPFAPGAPTKDDVGYYQGNPAYSRTIEITKEQYEKLQEFGNNPSGAGFDMQYNVLNNSCIDFVWKALDQVEKQGSGIQSSLFKLY